MDSFLVLLFGFFFAVQVAQASPLLLAPRTKYDVFVPDIISPNHATCWSVGQNETVRWKTSDAPQNISNGAAIYLDYLDSSSDSILLAKDFSLRAGQQVVSVPIIPAGTYKITLFGDSGDDSEPFSISTCQTQT